MGCRSTQSGTVTRCKKILFLSFFSFFLSTCFLNVSRTVIPNGRVLFRYCFSLLSGMEMSITCSFRFSSLPGMEMSITYSFDPSVSASVCWMWAAAQRISGTVTRCKKFFSFSFFFFFFFQLASSTFSVPWFRMAYSDIDSSWEANIIASGYNRRNCCSNSKFRVSILSL